MNMKKNNFIPLQYNNESSSFNAYDLDDFLFWAVDNEVSDITIQNEEMVFCEIHGKKHKVSYKRLIDILPGLKSEDSCCQACMSARENVLG
jgi:hypothetical protein